jgi:hypothetical protein
VSTAADVPPGVGACLRGADVTGARLNGTNFKAADIERLVGAPAHPPVIGWSSKPRAGACG